jgi:hypothetical protein
MIMKILKLISINLFFLLLFIEITSFIFVNFKNVSTRPTYKYQLRNHYGDYNKYFGAWHIPSSFFNHRKSCFDVNYSFNSYGARDVERNIVSKNKNRVIVLGDSVVEGYGVEDKNRITNLLESRTGIPHLNFGTSGHFGTTQYFLNYKYLSSKFSHNKVFLFFTITNDFEDDSFEIGKKIHFARYRPYFSYDEINKNFNLFYFDKKNLNNKKYLETIRNILSNYTYFYHLLRHYFSIIESTESKTIDKNQKPNLDKFDKKEAKINSYLYNYDEKVFSIIKNNLININKLAKLNSAQLYIIPVGHQTEHSHYINLKKYPKLLIELKELSLKNNIVFIDAFTNLKISSKNINNYFFSCDSHHNSEGNILIANYIYEKIYK